MSFFGALIPGIREIRAPLIAGYLWLICGWLLIEPHAPSPDGSRVYGRIAELAAVVGPVGRAIAVSIAAYLIGSLINSALKFFFRRWAAHNQGSFEADERKEELFRKFAETEQPLGIENIVKVADPLGEVFSDEPTLMHSPLHLSVREIVERELAESYRQLELAVLSIEERAGFDEVVLPFGVPSRAPAVGLPMPIDEAKRSYVEFIIPHFLLSKDLFEQIPLLQTRLLEVAETTGSQVERLYAEADFRFAIAPPLTALALILAMGANPLWLLTLCIPLALVVQGAALMQKGAEELVDALRARIQTPELQRVTPIFERYRTLASQLVEGLRKAEWSRPKA